MALRGRHAQQHAPHATTSSIISILRGGSGLSLAAGAALGALAFAAFTQWQGPALFAGTTLLVLVAAAVPATLWRFDVLRREMSDLRDEHTALATTGSAVAHDIRSPLVTIHSYLELLAEEAFGPLPADARRAAERAACAADRAQSLVELTLRAQTLEAAMRPRDAVAPPAPAATVPDLRVVLRDVVVSLETELAGTNAEVEVLELPPVRADSAALYRIFSNLLQNAIKYAVPGESPRVVVSGHVEGGRCELTVRDWGLGITPAEQERIFEPSTRGDRTAGQIGSGMGLAIVRSLVTEQGGRVWVDPAIADGTAIRIELPAA